MKKITKMIASAILSACLILVLMPMSVKADTFKTITLTYNNTVYSRQVYDIEIEQIKSGADTPSIQWVKDTCEHVAFITQNSTKILTNDVAQYVKLMLAQGSSVSLDLAKYTTDAVASAPAVLPTVTNNVPAVTVPAINPAMMGYNVMLSSCTTKYTEGQSRSTNIKVAASRINGMILLPGQGMSYSTSILPRTRANGYTLGGTISGGQHIQSIGGGICQVSSTLNAAVLRAGIIPTERHNHSEAIGYLKRGLDATVSEGVLDYQFVNTLPYPIFISTVAEGGQLTVAIYSTNSTGVMYDAVVEGANTYVVGYMNGMQVSKVFAYSSKYKK